MCGGVQTEPKNNNKKWGEYIFIFYTLKTNVSWGKWGQSLTSIYWFRSTCIQSICNRSVKACVHYEYSCVNEMGNANFVSVT